jgi:hypothetical protein
VLALLRHRRRSVRQRRNAAARETGRRHRIRAGASLEEAQKLERMTGSTRC